MTVWRYGVNEPAAGMRRRFRCGRTREPGRLAAALGYAALDNNLDMSNAQIVASAVTAGTQPPASGQGPGTSTETGMSTGEQTGTDQSSTGPQARSAMRLPVIRIRAPAENSISIDPPLLAGATGQGVRDHHRRYEARLMGRILRLRPKRPSPSQQQ